MTSPIVFPDAELLVVGHLSDRLGVYVCTTLPAGEEFNSRLPIVQVTRIGGGWIVRKRLDGPRMDLDIYATGRQAANDLTAQVRAEFEAMKGLMRDGAVVTRTFEETGPVLRPEERNSGVTRVGFTAGLVLRPA